MAKHINGRGKKYSCKFSINSLYWTNWQQTLKSPKQATLIAQFLMPNTLSLSKLMIEYKHNHSTIKLMLFWYRDINWPILLVCVYRYFIFSSIQRVQKMIGNQLCVWESKCWNCNDWCDVGWPLWWYCCVEN